MENRKLNFVSNKGKEKFKRYFWSDTKGKVIIGLIILVAILFALETVGNVPVTTAIQEPITIFTGFTQTLYNGGDQNPEPFNHHIGQAGGLADIGGGQ